MGCFQRHSQAGEYPNHAVTFQHPMVAAAHYPIHINRSAPPYVKYPLMQFVSMVLERGKEKF